MVNTLFFGTFFESYENEKLVPRIGCERLVLLEAAYYHQLAPLSLCVLFHLRYTSLSPVHSLSHNTTQHRTHTHTHRETLSTITLSHTHGGTGGEGGESKRAMKGKIIRQHGKKCSKQEDRRSRILRLCKPCNGLGICEHDRMKSDARTVKDAQEIVADLPFLGP
jgi:hypothetical protein